MWVKDLLTSLIYQTGEYRVTVYDEMESNMEHMVAYEHPKSLQISQIHPTSTLPASSVQQTGTTYICVAAFNSFVHNVTLLPLSV